MSEENKGRTPAREKKQALFHQKKNGYDRLPAGERQAMDDYCAGYKTFLDEGKIERECVTYAVALAEAEGFRPLVPGEALSAGDKVYVNNRGKSLFLAVIGTEPLDRGAVIGAAHIDSPRLDLKQNPLYEDRELAYLKTHYYGGIKKYQWTTIPLALHGLVVLQSGETVSIRIGEAPGDPQFTVGDLLPHLAADQAKKTMGDIVSAEQLNVFIGSRPFSQEEESDRVKLTILDLLHEKYGMVEEDFLSAELMAVPAVKAVDIGLDRSAIGAYGQDDRICAFTSLMAMLETDTPKRTACCLLVDKEEVGSQGASGMQSRFFENMTAEVLALMGYPNAISLRRTMQNSSMLSSDVSAGFDPLYADVFETKNAAYLGKGVVFNKFTGARGKSGSSDANPEFMAAIRRILDENEVQFQTAELGKVDVGGGGTIAWIMANYGMEVIDCGLAVLCMHAPMEISSKADVYEGVRAYKVFLEHMTNIYGL